MVLKYCKYSSTYLCVIYIYIKSLLKTKEERQSKCVEQNSNVLTSYFPESYTRLHLNVKELKPRRTQRRLRSIES